MKSSGGTKLRALYQRKKGRDLFDLFYALTNAKVCADEVISCYRRYMAFVVGHAPSYKEYVANLELKMQDVAFREDVAALLRSPITFSPDDAYALIKKCLIDKMDGQR